MEGNTTQTRKEPLSEGEHEKESGFTKKKKKTGHEVNSEEIKAHTFPFDTKSSFSFSLFFAIKEQTKHHLKFCQETELKKTKNLCCIFLHKLQG